MSKSHNNKNKVSKRLCKLKCYKSPSYIKTIKIFTNKIDKIYERNHITSAYDKMIMKFYNSKYTMEQLFLADHYDLFILNRKYICTILQLFQHSNNDIENQLTMNELCKLLDKYDLSNIKLNSMVNKLTKIFNITKPDLKKIINQYNLKNRKRYMTIVNIANNTKCEFVCEWFYSEYKLDYLFDILKINEKRNNLILM